MANDVNTQLDTAVMRTVARTIDNQATIIRNCFDSIRDDALRLKGTHWEGSSADAYYDSMIALCRDEESSGTTSAGQIVGILRDYVNNLNTAADEYERNESGIEDRFDGLSENVFGV